MSIEKYSAYFHIHVLGQARVGLHFAHMRISKKHFLKKPIANSYLENTRAYCDSALEREGEVLRNKAELFLLRNFGSAKTLRWPVEVHLYLLSSLLYFFL